ncbi:hypothetical protein [Bacillus pumilus]|uniref:hypothetical protein n=1 Tax=Bacillus pumilus TaxID=1408 RepID=UPI001D0134BB|nr:hypothetical protein [Bacillus pumilus]MDR7249732.1 hypothetical protein [Bacillus pumilus]MED1529105.1 hypothetical protein [Bacillus pumilus]UDF17774.1 hypothetical protein LG951_06175 [Bacillus pumilus]
MRLKKKLVISIIIGFVLFSSYYLLKNLFLKENAAHVSENEFKPSFLNDKLATIYLSASIDYQREGSYTIYMNKKGELTTSEGDAIELGSIAQGEQMLLKENPSEINILGKKTAHFKFKNKVHTGYGQANGYLKNKEIFYTLNNQGFGEKDYKSLIRWGNSQNFHEQILNGYFVSTGNDEDKIYVINQDMDTDRSTFQELNLEDKPTLQNGGHIKLINEDWEVYSNIIIKDKLAYFILYHTPEDSKDVSFKVAVFDIEKKKLRGAYLLGSYKSEDQLIPPNEKHFYIKDDILYHLTANSKIYTFNTKTMKPEESYSLEHEEGLNVKFVYLNSDHIYLLNQKKTGEYEISSYSYQKGKRLNSLKIKGLDKILDKNHVSEYDFLMLEQNRNDILKIFNK